MSYRRRSAERARGVIGPLRHAAQRALRRCTERRSVRRWIDGQQRAIRTLAARLQVAARRPNRPLARRRWRVRGPLCALVPATPRLLRLRPQAVAPTRRPPDRSGHPESPGAQLRGSQLRSLPTPPSLLAIARRPHQPRGGGSARPARQPPCARGESQSTGRPLCREAARSRQVPSGRTSRTPPSGARISLTLSCEETVKKSCKPHTHGEDVMRGRWPLRPCMRTSGQPTGRG